MLADEAAHEARGRAVHEVVAVEHQDRAAVRARQLLRPLADQVHHRRADRDPRRPRRAGSRGCGAAARRCRGAAASSAAAFIPRFTPGTSTPDGPALLPQEGELPSRRQPGRVAGSGSRVGVVRPALRPGLLERRQDQVRRLRAGDPVALVDGEERHAVDPEQPCAVFVGAHLVAEAVAGQDVGDLAGLEPDVAGESREDVAPADRLTFGEVARAGGAPSARPAGPRPPRGGAGGGRRTSCRPRFGRGGIRGLRRPRGRSSGAARPGPPRATCRTCAARCSAPRSSRCGGAVGSSSKLLQTTSTSSRCGKRASACLEAALAEVAPRAHDV